MKLHTLVIDDEPLALQKLTSYVEKVPFLELSGACSSAAEALEVLAQGNTDLIFTDISMPGLSGMELVSSLTKPVMVVFTTAHENYALDSYRLGAVDYLLKPYSFVDFQRAANRALSRKSTSADSASGAARESIFVKVDHRHVRVPLANVRYIKGFGEYLQIFIEGEDNPLLTLSSFAALKDKLSADFVQIHRSYVVNMNKVEQIERSRIVMDSATYLPVGDSFRQSVQTYLASCAIGRAGAKA